jgi:hypothetical protein
VLLPRCRVTRPRACSCACSCCNCRDRNGPR